MLDLSSLQSNAIRDVVSSVNRHGPGTIQLPYGEGVVSIVKGAIAFTQ